MAAIATSTAARRRAPPRQGAADVGATHNRLRDWHKGHHPGYALARWLQDYREQVLLFTRDLTVSWTNNAAERAVKAPKRHQAVSGYWHTLEPSPAGASSAATSPRRQAAG